MRSRPFCALFVLLLAAVVFSACDRNSGRDVSRVRSFISENWDGSVEYTPEDNKYLIGLPNPYSVPTVHGEVAFKEMYYWDTYFTNSGLLLDGRSEQALRNADNIIYIVNRFGKMLNGSNFIYLNRSQPPFLSMIVSDIYSEFGDREWLSVAVDALEREYEFWMTRRMTPCGLNRYSNEATDQKKTAMAHYLRERFDNQSLLDGMDENEILVKGSHYIAEAESGWDFNPRFGGRCEDFCPVDLNAYLYMYEVNFARFYRELGRGGESGRWEQAARRRKELIDAYCYDPRSGLYYDYDYVNDTRSAVVSSAVFALMFAGVVDHRQARALVRNALPQLETDFGLRACCEGPYDKPYQWGDINGWPQVHFLAARGLDNYGYRREAERIRRKFVRLVSDNFHSTGNLWEKYNILDGSVNTCNEYAMPAFLGWTAGTFITFTEQQK